MSLLSLEDAQREILALVQPGPPIQVALEEAAGLCVLSNVVAPHPLPRFANSSMDGYAVRRADVEGSVQLRVVGEIRAGAGADRPVGAGETMRIMTGAPLPSGADAVLPIEVAIENQGILEVQEVPELSYVRPAGDDIEAGAVAVEAGRPLGPGELALLAALGADPIEVRSAPHVAVITSGDELVAPAQEPGPGQIRDSNAVALSSLVREANASVAVFARIHDDPDAVTATLQTAAADAALVLSAGGVSVGRHDYIREVVERDGDVVLWRVAVQPGKPLLAGRVYGTPFIGLPGNPVSVHVGFEQFVRPALRKMLGCRDVLRPVARAVLGERMTKPSGRLHLVRVTLALDAGRLVATPTGPQGSHIQTSLVGCDGLVRFPADLTELEAGAEVELEVWRLPSVL